MAVVIALVQKRHFALLLERYPELKYESENKGDERGFERSGEPAGNALQGSADR